LNQIQLEKLLTKASMIINDLNVDSQHTKQKKTNTLRNYRQNRKAKQREMSKYQK